MAWHPQDVVPVWTGAEEAMGYVEEPEAHAI